MKHTREELDQFIGFLKEIEEVTWQMPMVILESTGHYHSPVIQYMEEQEILYILLNPIISYQAKKSSLRHSKVSLSMLKEYPTSEAVLTAGESRLVESVMDFCPRRSDNGQGKKQKKKWTPHLEIHLKKSSIKVT